MGTNRILSWTSRLQECSALVESLVCKHFSTFLIPCPYTGQNISFVRMFSLGWESCLQALLNLPYTLFPTPFFGISMKTDLVQWPCGHCWVFQICWHIECSTFTASSSRIWNSSTGIPSSPLALFVVMLPEAHLTSHSRMSGSRWDNHHRDYLSSEDLFCTVLLCILATSS